MLGGMPAGVAPSHARGHAWKSVNVGYPTCRDTRSASPPRDLGRPRCSPIMDRRYPARRSWIGATLHADHGSALPCSPIVDRRYPARRSWIGAALLADRGSALPCSPIMDRRYPVRRSWIGATLPRRSWIGATLPRRSWIGATLPADHGSALPGARLRVAPSHARRHAGSHTYRDTPSAIRMTRPNRGPDCRSGCIRRRTSACTSRWGHHGACR